MADILEDADTTNEEVVVEDAVNDGQPIENTQGTTMAKDCKYEDFCESGGCDPIVQGDIKQFVSLDCAGDDSLTLLPSCSLDGYLNLFSGKFEQQELTCNSRTFTISKNKEKWETQTFRYVACKDSRIVDPKEGSIEDFFVNKTCVGDQIYLHNMYLDDDGNEVIEHARFKVQGKLQQGENLGDGSSSVHTYQIDLIQTSPASIDCGDIDCPA